MKYYHKTTIFTIHHYTLFLFLLITCYGVITNFYISPYIHNNVYTLHMVIKIFIIKPDTIRVMVSLQNKYKKFYVITNNK